MFLKFKPKSFFAIIALVVCFHTTSDAQKKISNPVLITVETGNCLVGCPIYSAQIYSDGTVIYKGVDSVKVIGRKRYKISKDTVKKLTAEFRRIKFLSLKDVYDAGEVDVSAFVTTVLLDGQRKKVTNYSGAPKKLNELHIRILRDANLFDYVGPL